VILYSCRSLDVMSSVQQRVQSLQRGKKYHNKVGGAYCGPPALQRLMRRAGMSALSSIRCLSEPRKVKACLWSVLFLAFCLPATALAVAAVSEIGVYAIAQLQALSLSLPSSPLSCCCCPCNCYRFKSVCRSCGAPAPSLPTPAGCISAPPVGKSAG
jgi:hypothetical protein